PNINPRPLMFFKWGRCCAFLIKYADISSAFFIKFSDSKTFKTAKDAAQAKWFPPKVVPNNPKDALIFGWIKIPPIGKPLPMPLAMEIISGVQPYFWNAKKSPVLPNPDWTSSAINIALYVLHNFSRP